MVPTHEYVPDVSDCCPVGAGMYSNLFLQYNLILRIFGVEFVRFCRKMSCSDAPRF